MGLIPTGVRVFGNGNLDGDPWPAACRPLKGQRYMERQVIIGLYVVLLVAVIVSVDFLFFRREFWERLIANSGIVLVFIAFYLRFIKTR